MVPLKKEIYKILTDNIDTIRGYGVKRIGLFGSCVRETNQESSDIDLLVEFYRDKKTYDNYFDLSEFLESVLHTKIDLVTVESLSPYFASEVMKEVEYIEIAA